MKPDLRKAEAAARLMAAVYQVHGCDRGVLDLERDRLGAVVHQLDVRYH